MRRHAAAADRPNIVFIMTDDHAAHAIGAYGSRVNQTPNLDRLAREGALLENVFATDSICTPSRAAILTGQYSHINARFVDDERGVHARLAREPPLAADADVCRQIRGREEVLGQHAIGRRRTKRASGADEKRGALKSGCGIVVTGERCQR